MAYRKKSEPWAPDRFRHAEPSIRQNSALPQTNIGLPSARFDCPGSIITPFGRNSTAMGRKFMMRLHLTAKSAPTRKSAKGKKLGAAAMAIALLLPAQALAQTITFESDPILYWNERATTLLASGPPAQTRTLAMMNIAMHDAANSVLGEPDKAYLSGVSGSGGDVRAAVSQAAYQVLVAADPTHAADYQAALNLSLSLVSNPAAMNQGIATGSAFAQSIIALRTGDGATAVVPYVPTGLPGNWKPTSPAPPAFPQWGGVTPFLLTSSDQFKPAPPPGLGTPEYAAALAEVRDVGSATSLTRTADQTASALFWDTANGSTWVKIGLLVADDEGLSTIEFARDFALLSTSLADAAIAGFDAKYDYAFWRPITAIREDPTNPDPNWSPVFTTPNHPSYPSAHSFLSGAGSTVLSALFGDDEGFTLTIGGDTRSFTGLEQAALDGANSRLWGGIHFRFDNEAGLLLGQNVGNYVLAGSTFQAAVPEPSGWIMMIAGFGAAGAGLRRQRRRQAFA
ncbi:phosphatase PAP2 family protein [Sphingomonas sp. JC676]|uniref:vanadium-dependent haloperoxidase n=1 Tax=Sphingomonas sp. JC676 TaxID=2768065 RepID=UPI00165844BF|nr:vanadium-dependent haloperoxidase [Sphingomonas sp. JC676]MBC9034315.1 phosphatase PAP2 family protein [Sphingomonas sp. JC676]